MTKHAGTVLLFTASPLASSESLGTGMLAQIPILYLCRQARRYMRIRTLAPRPAWKLKLIDKHGNTLPRDGNRPAVAHTWLVGHVRSL